MNINNRINQDTGAGRLSHLRNKWLLLFGSIFLFMLAAEISLRICGYGEDRGPSFQGYVGAGIRLMCYDQNLNGYLDVDLANPTIRKNFYDDFGVMDMEQTYHYTPHGVVTPCDEREMRPGQIRPKQAGKIRLIAIGDSFTYGHGLKQGDPWPRQLETFLNSDGKGHFEVLNCGIGDTDVGSSSRLFMDHLLTLRPDAVVYGWYLNDPLQSQSFEEANRELTIRALSKARYVPDRYVSVGWETITGVRRLSAIYDLVLTKWNKRTLGRLTLAWINGMYGPDNADGWAESQRLLGTLAMACRDRGAVLHMAIWPMLIDLGPDYPLAPAHQAIVDACRRLGISCVDLRNKLADHPINALILHSEDRHPSKTACRLAAEAIHDHLCRQHVQWFDESF